MAKIIFGPIVAEARGRQGNLVYSRNRAGAYTRPYVVPDETWTPARDVVWTRMADACTVWNDDLDDSQRSAWDAFAKLIKYPDVFHRRKNHPGRTLFISNYLYLDNLNLAINLDPPPSTRRFHLTSATLAINSDDQEILLDLDWQQIQDQPPVIVHATPPLNAARYSPSNRWKQIVALPDNATYPYNLWTPYTAVHAAPTTGQRIILKALPIHPTTGLPGVPLLCSAQDAGTGDAMLHTQVTVPTASVLTLQTNPYQILPAPGPAKVIYLIDAAYTLIFNTTPYTVPGGSLLTLLFTSGATPDQRGYDSPGFLDAAADRFQPTYELGAGDPLTTFENQPLMLKQGGSNPTLGDSDLIVDVFYSIITLP